MVCIFNSFIRVQKDFKYLINIKYDTVTGSSFLHNDNIHVNNLECYKN
jgi:hypothetical protein